MLRQQLDTPAGGLVTRVGPAGGALGSAGPVSHVPSSVVAAAAAAVRAGAASPTKKDVHVPR
jgi:hypothetical protein